MAKPQSVAEFERRYEEIYRRMEGIGAGEHLSRAREALARNAGTWRYYGSSRQGEEVSDYSLQERNSVRQLRSRLSAVKPENREAADGLFDFMGQMQETQQRLDVMCSYLEEMQNYIDSQDAPEEHEALYEDIAALMQDMNAKRAEYLYARRYNSLVMDTMLGGGEAEMSQEELDASGPAWDGAKGEFGITDIPWEAKDARAAAASMAVSRPAGVYMDIQASDPQLAQAFRDGMGDRDRYFTQQMTLAQKGFAVENFDMAFNNYVFSKEEQRTLESQGKDIFDQIFIDGQSLNERYGDKYASLPYYSAAEAMKCEFMADVLQGRQVSVLMAGEEPEIIPLEVQSQLAPIQEAVVNRQRIRNLSFADDIFRSQEELGKRTGQEIWEKRYRMRDKRPLYEDMDSVEPVRAAQISVSAADAGDKFALGENTGSLLGADGDSEEVKRRKERMVSVGRSLFVSLNNQADISMNSSEIYRQMGITESGELFYIDGVPAADYIKTKYPGLKSKTEDMATYSKVLQSEIASAALNGRHRVEAVKVGMDERGAFQVGLVECRVNLENLDGQERFYQTRPSRRSQRLWDDDPDRQTRQSRIQAEFTDRLLAGARKELLQREAARDPFVMEAQRFSLGNQSLNKSFFDAAAMAEIQSHPASETVELRRGDYGGYRSYAQLLLMARHPEIRFADLMDPEKYREEKLAAGWEVASAFSTLYAGPAAPEDKEFAKPAAGIMKEAMGVISRLDIRQEMFYALGQPVPDTKEGVMAVMNDPKNQAVINGVLGGLGLFSVNTFQALNRIHKNVVTVSTMDLENPSERPVYRELAALLTPEEQAAYQRGNHALRSLNAEVMMNRRYRDYLQGNGNGNDLLMVSYGLCAAHMRDLIGEYGRGTAIPQDQILSDGRGVIGGEMEERLKEAMARGEVTMAQVLEGSVSRTYREQLIREAAEVVARRNAEVGRRVAQHAAEPETSAPQAAGPKASGQEAQVQAAGPEVSVQAWQPGLADGSAEVTMDFKEDPEINANELAAHIARPQKLTDRERDYALNTFDQTFARLMTLEQSERLQTAGIDMFDVITIDGQSVRERFGEKYRALEPEERERMFKMEVVSAALKSDAGIAFSTMEEQPDHSVEFGSPVAVKRGGQLHEPRPTLGQGFLNALGIRKIVPLQEQWRKANEQAARGISDFERRMPEFSGALGRVSRASRTNFVDREFEELTGISFDQLKDVKGAMRPYTQERQGIADRAEGFVNLADMGLDSMGRPTAYTSLIYGQMMGHGMALKDIMDPGAKTEEKRQIIQELNEELKTPEGIGKAMAQATKAFSSVNLKKEFAEILGRNIHSQEEFMAAITEPEDAMRTLPAMRFLYTYGREMLQTTESLHFEDGNERKPHTDAQRECRNAYFQDMSAEDLEARRNFWEFNRVQGNEQSHTAYERAIRRGAGRIGDDEIREIAPKAAMIRELYGRAAECDVLGQISVPADQFHAYSKVTLPEARTSEARAYIEGLGSAGAGQFEADMAREARGHEETLYREGREEKLAQAGRLKTAAEAARVQPQAAPETAKAAPEDARKEEPKEERVKTSFTELSQRINGDTVRRRSRSNSLPGNMKKGPALGGAPRR